MGKYRTTKKAMKESYDKIICVSYCNLQNLLRFQEPFAYSARSEGWSCDYYDIDGILISTGYAPIDSKRTKSTYDICRKYEVAAQEFLNKQAIERVGTPKMRTDSFDYTDEEGVIHRYFLYGVNRKGEIISYLEEIVNKFTEEQLYEKYGYLMDKTHGIDTELLMDIMKCNGLDVEEKNRKYFVIDK